MLLNLVLLDQAGPCSFAPPESFGKSWSRSTIFGPCARKTNPPISMRENFVAIDSCPPAVYETVVVPFGRIYFSILLTTQDFIFFFC